MFKKKFLLLVGILLFGTITGRSYAAEKANIYFFWGEGCPHCAKEKEFLQKVVTQRDDVRLHAYEVYNSEVNQERMMVAAQKLKTAVNGVPFIVIGDKHLVGYNNDETTGKKIVEMIDKCTTSKCPDIFDATKSQDNGIKPEQVPINNGQPPIDTDLPKIGNMDLSSLSLPALAVTLGFLDGFNPCAMWTLLFLISLLVGMNDKKRMWALGIAFIVTSAAVYFLFMAAWLNLLLFIGFIFWVRLVIGVIALVGGVISARKFFTDTTGCDVSGQENRKNIFEKLGKITSSKSFLFALVGIIGLAFAVNLVELICSAGFPAVFTQVLALNQLSTLNYYAYILLYILFFMIDDLFVFFVAMITLHMTGITTKYVKYSRLIGGILMILIGILMIFKPELLMFS